MSAEHLIAAYGLAGLGVIVFAETAVLLGVVLPAETLLVLAGAYSEPRLDRASFDLVAVMAVAAVAAVAGGQVGYVIGRRGGPALFERDGSWLSQRGYAQRTQRYFARFGGRTVILARFIPVVRTFAAPAAGVGRVSAGRFAGYNALGGVAWAVAIASLGHGLAEIVPVDRYLLPTTSVIVAVSALPILVEAARRRGRSRSSRKQHDNETRRPWEIVSPAAPPLSPRSRHDVGTTKR